MKTKSINLHMEQKRALLIMLSFSLMLILVGTVIAFSVGRDFSQLSSLLRSDYEYSANIKNPIRKDDYYQFDAGISFSTKVDAQMSINAEILMQANNVQYTGLVDWNASRLEADTIAVTRGLARSYRLKAGDLLYSKHIVDGALYAYRIEQILPDISCVRVLNGKNYTDGVIIMGYDDQYADNLMHTNIILTNTPVEELSSSQSNMPVNVVYRTEEIATTIQEALPYLVIFFLLSILISYGLVAVSYRNVKCNIKRMVMLGFDKKGIDISFRKLICRMGFSVITAAFMFSLVVAFISGFSFIEGIYFLFLLCTESITVLTAIFALTRRIWR